MMSVAALAVVPVPMPNFVLLLRPDEVLSGIPDAPVLEVADNAFGVLFKPHHVRVGGFT